MAHSKRWNMRRSLLVINQCNLIDQTPVKCKLQKSHGAYPWLFLCGLSKAQEQTAGLNVYPYLLLRYAPIRDAPAHQDGLPWQLNPSCSYHALSRYHNENAGAV